MFKKVATLQFRKIYASDSNGNYYWRDFVKEANSKLATDANFVPKSFYEYDTKNFLYITARAISGMEKWGCNGNFDAFPWEELKKSYATFCGKGFYIEHKEDDEMDAKGIILDAQPDEDNEFINCICAISKEEYPDICEQILNGQLNQVSMSCLAGTCGCSLCGNEATKEEELCEHMNPKHPNFCKGQIGSNGQPIYEINKDIMFTGLSGVAVPADKDAFIFDVKASKKQNGKTINKEYNKYCRAKKEYEYINSLLEKEDTRKYIESKLKKAFQDIKGKSWEDVLNKISELGYEFDEHYYDEPYKFIKALKDNKEYEIELFGYNNGSYEVTGISDTGKTYKDLGEFLVNSSLKKKADIEYMSDTIKEIPPIDFETEFMLAGKSKGINTDINKDQLEIGIKVEMEHTTNPVIAEKIAMDHIKEIPNYYTLLAEMEAKAKFEFEQAKDIINKETNEELPTKLASKQFFKVRKAENININNISSRKAFELLKNNIVTKSDGESFNKLINVIINDNSYYAMKLLEYNIITKQSDEYNTIINKIIESGIYGYDLIRYKYITKQDGELYNKALDKFLDKADNEYIYDLVKNKKITKEDGNLFYKALSYICQLDADYIAKGDLDTPTDDLIWDGIITKEDVEKAKQFNKQSSKQFFKARKAAGHGFANVIKFKTDKDFYDKIKQLRKNKNIEVIYKIIDGVGLYLLYKGNEHLGTLNTHELTYYFDTDMSKQASKQFFKLNKANNSEIKIGDHVRINYKLGDWVLNNVLGKVLDVRTNDNGSNYYIVKIFGTNTTYTFHDQDLTLVWNKRKSSKQKQWFKIANIYDDPEERNDIDNYGLSELQRKELQNVIDHIDIVNEDIVVTWDELVESVNQDILDYDFMNKNKVNIMDYIENELGQKIEAY